MTTAGRAVFTRDYVLLLLAVFGALVNYAPLLSVVPLWADAGGAGGAGVGATTGVMMGATVATQLAMPWLFRILTLRRMVAVGALVMGVATPAYALSSALGPVLAVSAVRGAGFALVVVAGAALVSELVADTHLSRGTGFFGLAAGLPNVVALPAGVLLAQRVGFVPVFIGCTVLALAAVPLILAMRGGGRYLGRRNQEEVVPAPRPQVGRAGSGPGGSGPGGSGHRDVESRSGRGRSVRPLTRPALVFLATAIGLGGATTFLPLAVVNAGTASVALFALSLGMIAGRVGAGTIGDQVRPGRILLPGVILGGLGMGGVALATGTAGALPAVVVGASGLFGLAFGAVQNDALVVILRRAGRGGHGTASTVWNLAYDGGTGVGAVLLGAVVAGADYSWAFGAAAVAMALTVPAAWRVDAGRVDIPDLR